MSVETELLHLQNYSFRTTFHSHSYFNMPLSIVLDSSQRKSAREAAIKEVNKDLELMIISISYDGSTRFGQNICCGILNSDSTQHAFYTMKINIADANPFGPPIITIAEVNRLAQRHMRSLGIDIDETYDMSLVTNRKCNIEKESAASPKWKAVVEHPLDTTEYIPGTASDPNTDNRLPHIFYGVRVTTIADESNLGGSSKATNVSKIMQSCETSVSILELKFIDSKGELPYFMERFSFCNIKAMRSLYTLASNVLIERGTFDESGTFHRICYS